MIAIVKACLLVVLVGCGTASGPAPLDAATDAMADAPEVGTCSYTRDNGDHVDCKSTETWCPDPNPLCGNDCKCVFSFDAYYLACTPDQCGLDGGVD
jgi:hypothetical protein